LQGVMQTKPRKNYYLLQSVWCSSPNNHGILNFPNQEKFRKRYPLRAKVRMSCHSAGAASYDQQKELCDREKLEAWRLLCKSDILFERCKTSSNHSFLVTSFGCPSYRRKRQRRRKQAPPIVENDSALPSQPISNETTNTCRDRKQEVPATEQTIEEISVIKDEPRHFVDVRPTVESHDDLCLP
jgi:hypothetical protein